MNRTTLRTAVIVLGILLCAQAPGYAYVGPGAGFAFVSSIFIIIFTTFLAVLTLLTWPIRWVVQRIRGSKAMTAARVRRVVVLGLDGQDPELTEQFMREGLLPNFTRLSKQGTFRPLQTTLLAESPVAWASFQTGCNPGKHRIFDFLVPNRKSHLPELCSARVDPPKRTLRLGPFRLPLGKPVIRAGRRSQPFWKILGGPRHLQHGSPCADHLSGREVQRRPAVGDECPGSARQPGHLLLLQQRPWRRWTVAPDERPAGPPHPDRRGRTRRHPRS